MGNNYELVNMEVEDGAVMDNVIMRSMNGRIADSPIRLDVKVKCRDGMPRGVQLIVGKRIVIEWQHG